MKNKKIILASASPRRKELLSLITEDFEVIVPDVDEIRPDSISVDEFPEYIACKKAAFISKKFSSSVVIAADTCVIFDNQILGKPKDRDDAYNMLKMLSGNTHKVITGCAIFKGDKTLSFSSETLVEFYNLSDEQINEYLNTVEPYDKAGSYGIQSKGALFVKKIDGDYFNVVGLPISKLNIFLKDLA